MCIKPNKMLMLAAAVVVMLNFNSCKYEDGPAFSLRTKTARLTGEWEVVEIDNEKPFDNGKLILEFEKDGDFTISIAYDGTDSSFDGEWEWESGKESIEVKLDGGDKEEWDILRLTNDEFWFESESGDEYKCEKEK